MASVASVIFLGIDPGKAGGLAWISRLGTVLEVAATPLLPGRGAGEYDLATIRTMLMGRSRVDDLRAFVELLPDLPPGLQFGGMKAARARGVAEGWAWALAMLCVPYELVKPKNWQKVMLADIPGEDTKARSIIAAQRLFPGADLRPTPRCRKPSDGISDALLIAEWGRRRLGCPPLLQDQVVPAALTHGADEPEPSGERACGSCHEIPSNPPG